MYSHFVLTLYLPNNSSIRIYTYLYLLDTYLILTSYLPNTCVIFTLYLLHTYCILTLHLPYPTLYLRYTYLIYALLSFMLPL